MILDILALIGAFVIGLLVAILVLVLVFGKVAGWDE